MLMSGVCTAIVMLYGSYSERTTQQNKENHKALYIFYAINSAFFWQLGARRMEAARTHTLTDTTQQIETER